MMMETIENVWLLKTKYSIPRINKQIINRKTLNSILDDALIRKLTVITAPAGYGKTTTVLKWLENNSLPSAWFSIDTGDNDPILFWSYLCAALDNIYGGISDEIKYVYTSPELFKANIHISILIDSLFALGKEFLFVLDDIHLIKNQAILEGLAYFIKYMPKNVHLILISRVEPSLKLAKLGLEEELVRIGSKDLRFKAMEIEQYYESKGYFLQKEELERIESYTEGWVTALVAVAFSLKDEKHRQNIIKSFISCNLHIEEYLVEDVFNYWTIEQQDFMIKTSILDRLSGELCEAVIDKNSSRLLEELYDNNSFLTALDDRGVWFRYHNLFFEFLRKKAKKLDVVIVRELHNKAGKWFKINNYFNEAIDHFLKAKEYKEAVTIIEDYGRDLTRRGEILTVISWIEKIPDKFIDKSMSIKIIRAVYCTDKNDFKNAWEFVNSAENLLKNDEVLYKPYSAELFLAKMNIFYRQGDIKNSLAVIGELAASGLIDTTDRPYADFNFFEISAYRTSLNTFIKALRMNPEIYYSIIQNYRLTISVNPGYAPLIEAEYNYEISRFDEALPKLIEAFDEAINAKCAGALIPATVTFAKIKRAKGDIKGAVGIIEECEDRIRKFHKPHWSYILEAFKARLYIDMGDTIMLDKWMMQNRLNIYQNIDKMHEYELIVFSRVLIEKQRYEEAKIILSRLLSFAEGLKRNHSIVEILNLLAIMAMKNLDDENAIKYFDKALSLGIEEGYERSFVDELSPMVSLLKMYIAKNKKGSIEMNYAKKMLSLSKDNAKNFIITIDSSALENLLTSMEKKVLHYILNAYTNGEIAEKLGITLRTVKAHTSNIYKKLDVKNRAQCIKKVKGDFLIH